MNLLIATDIFGKTPALEALADQLASRVGSHVIVDPYGGMDRKFDSESEAYAVFQRTIGLEAYIQMVSTAIECLKAPVFLIGFSVGASAVWALSGESVLSVGAGTRAICFYGSQIRHFMHVNPLIELDLIFPAHEPHFQVADLMERLSLHKRVRCHQAPYLHGFMNRLSTNFNAVAYDDYSQMLRKKMAMADRGE